MICDPSGNNSDAAINKNDLSLTPKTSPLIANQDLISNKSSEVSTSSLQTKNLSPKKQLDSPLSRVGGRLKASKRLKETNLVKNQKSHSGDPQFKHKSAEIHSIEDEVSADTLCNSIESDITSGKPAELNSGCDIKSNNAFVNNKLASISNRDSINATPEVSSSQNQMEVQSAVKRPTTNLIRREDSWQSLVSLTRVGKVGPASMQGK